ncbi:MAG: hypothetical protein CR986_05975 [Ignavibacteriae bacterium]|nr:MAG: hypothetical protein CR986_05975 [Ignavibacteriota bacterium]
MKNIKIITLIVLSMVFFYACEKSDNGTEPDDKDNNNLTLLLPYKIGNIYTFNIDTLNLSTQSYENIGTRKTTVLTKIEIDDYSNILCENKYFFQNVTQSFNVMFKVSETEISCYADTIAIKQLVPDSLSQNFQLITDGTFNLLNRNYSDNESWVVYKVAAKTLFGKFNILIIDGSYIGEEEIKLNELNKTVTAKKVEYSIKLKIPDINNPLQTHTKNTKAYIWFTQEYGIIKLEGSALLINPIGGYLFTPADSSRTVRHILTASE